MEKGFCSHLFLLLHKDATFLIPRFKFVLSTCTSQRSMHDMTATVARCHFWWNNFFFLLLLFSSFFSSITTSLLLLLLLTTTHTHTCRGNSERTKKWGSLLFFSFSSFTPFYYFMYGAASASLSRWCSCFLGNDRTTRKREREGEMPWFRLLCLGKQQSIDLLFIIGHYSLSSTPSISLSFFFFCQQRLYANALLFAYTCHCAMFREYKHTCTNEADDDSSAIHTTKKKSLNVLMACIEKETGGKEIQWKEKLHTCMDWFNERLDIKLERMVVTDV